MDHLRYVWNEKQIQFFSACLIQSLTSLRKEKLIHRDLHIVNLVLDEKQYINLIDFHASIEYKNKDSQKDYLFRIRCAFCAPEIKKYLSYGYNSDYYRLGAMLYYVIFKKFPNIVKSQKKLGEFQINYNETKNYSFACIDFINKLLISNSKKRIGYYSIEELKNHDFFKNFEWNKFIIL